MLQNLRNPQAEQQQQSQLQQQSQQQPIQQNIQLASMRPPAINANEPENQSPSKKKEQENIGQPKKIQLPSELNSQNQINLTRLVKSDFYSDLDRKADYDEITFEIRREGLFGLSKINMEDIDDAIIAKKAQLEGRGEQEQKGLKDELLSKNRPKSEMDDLLRKDGIYITNESQWLYLLEEQLQKQRMKDNDRFLLKLFKKNADLVTDEEFFDEKISKIRIISQKPNQALAIKRRPAVMCERLNQNKHIPYRLRVYIGKIQLTKHYKMIKEETQIQDLIQKVNEYKERCDLALIPHYDKALRVIENEIAFLEHSAQRQPKKQIAILENERNKLSRFVADEANLIKNLMDDIVERWKQIQNIRQAQNKNHNPYKLYAKQYRNAENGQELEFILVKDTYTEDKEAERSEQRRRALIKGERIYVQLLVNGQDAGRSQACSIDWPSFEVKIMEQFYILLFTRPKSMQLKIFVRGVIDKVIDIIDLEIPGEKSKTITATSQVLSEVEFCQGQSARRAQKLQEIENEKKKLIEKARQDEIAREQLKKEEMMNQANKKKSAKKEEKKEDDPAEQGKQEENNEAQNQQMLSPEQQEEKRKEEEKKMIQLKMEQLQQQEQRARDSATYRGKVSVLSEWTGQGDKMPPHNIDNFGKGQATNQDLMQAFKDPNDEVNKIIEDTEDDGFHFDVNDPRNELQLEKLRNLRFKDQRAKVLRDIFLPFAHIDSLREKLIKCSMINPEITYIPMTEDEIYNNNDLMRLIEKTEQGLYLQEELDLEEQQAQKKTMFLENVAITSKEVFDLQQKETKKRIENIKRILLKRQKFAMLRKQNNKDGAPLTLKNVVNEYIIGENEIVIFELIKQCFTQQRKLQPKKKKEEKIRLQDIKDGINFLFHISHGTNVPLRDDDLIRDQVKHLIKTRTDAMMYPMYGGFMPQGNMMMQPGYNMEHQKMIDQNANKKDPRADKIFFRNITELERVNSFVQIKLVFEKKEYIIESKPFEGNNPDWSSDRSLFLPQLQNKKLSNYELFDSSNQIIVSLFDKKFIRKFGKENKKKQIRTEHDFFLGNISIPLYTLFQNQKLTATFRLNRPIIILGYYTDNTSLLGLDSGQENNSKVRIDPLIPTTISLSINVDPFIEIVQENDDIFYGDGQDSRLEYYANKWLEKFRKHKDFSKRHIKIWGQDIEQNSFYLPRYLTKLAPPNIFTNNSRVIDIKDLKNDIHAIEKVARFVSLIPFKNDTELFKDIPDIHCDSQQFLDLKGGDFEEHAFLLCNYFNYIDTNCGRTQYKSYVILGHAIPEGKTFYVLRRDCQNNKIEVWNPSTGEPFVMTTELKGTQFLCCVIGKNKQSVIQRYDKACPLYDVGCVIDEKNIYVNIQKSGAPSQIEWNIENKQLWQPFLDDAQIEMLFGEVGIESIYKGEDALKYEVTPTSPIDQLSLTIQQFIINRITESRGSRVNTHSEHRSIIKDQLLQQLESMKYKCRFSGLGVIIYQ